MRFNFINIPAYEIKLTQKFKYTENLAGAHMMQVDVDACCEWRPSKLQVIFVVTITIKVRIWMLRLVCL